jgi:hypothetical protein
MVWILILHIIKQKKDSIFKINALQKSNLNLKNRINLKQNKFYLPKKKKLETWKKQKKSQNKWKRNLTLTWLEDDCCSKLLHLHKKFGKEYLLTHKAQGSKVRRQQQGDKTTKGGGQ